MKDLQPGRRQQVDLEVVLDNTDDFSEFCKYQEDFEDSDDEDRVYPTVLLNNMSTTHYPSGVPVNVEPESEPETRVEGPENQNREREGGVSPPTLGDEQILSDVAEDGSYTPAGDMEVHGEFHEDLPHVDPQPQVETGTMPRTRARARIKQAIRDRNNPHVPPHVQGLRASILGRVQAKIMAKRGK